MTEDSIGDIRRKAISEIKEKVKKNPRYLYPCNKERQEDMKRFKFANGNAFTHWMRQNRIMESPINIDRRVLKKMIYDWV